MGEDPTTVTLNPDKMSYDDAMRFLSEEYFGDEIEVTSNKLGMTVVLVNRSLAIKELINYGRGETKYKLCNEFHDHFRKLNK